MNRKATTVLLLILGAIPVAIGVALRSSGPGASPVDVDAVPGLLRAGRFAAAERTVRMYLSEHPGQSSARLLLAQVLISADRSDPDPAAAIRTLKSARSGDRKIEAAIRWTEGKAWQMLGGLAEAEAAWRIAIDRDPLNDQAFESLLELYYLEGRESDTRELVSQRFEVERDKRKLGKWCLYPVRRLVMEPSPALVLDRLGAAAKREPIDFHARRAYGLALVHDGRVEEGLGILRETVERDPRSKDAWIALLTGLDDSGRPDEFASTLARLPQEHAVDPAFLIFKARAASDQGDFEGAARDYKLAERAGFRDPKTTYRLIQALRRSGRVDEAKEVDRRFLEDEETRKTLKALYNKAVELAGRAEPERNAEVDRAIALGLKRLGFHQDAERLLATIPH